MLLAHMSGLSIPIPRSTVSRVQRIVVVPFVSYWCYANDRRLRQSLTLYDAPLS